MDETSQDTPEAKERAPATVKPVSPRAVLMLVWCLWLIGSLMVTWRLHAVAVWGRLMPLNLILGLMLIWPAIRLSVGPISKHVPLRESPAVSRIIFTGVLADWAGLNAINQVVLLGLTVTADWSITQTVWMDMAILSWSLLAAAMVAVGCRTFRAGPRAVSMLICVLLVIGEPLAMVVASIAMGPDRAIMWDMHISPLQVIWALSEQGQLWTVEPHHRHIIAVGVAAVMAWMMLILFAKRHHGD